jgi:hypothetical protein
MTTLNDRFLREMHEFPGRVEAILGPFALSLLVLLSVALRGLLPFGIRSDFTIVTFLKSYFSNL